MKCEEAKDQLVLLAYEELSDEQQATLELHLHGCPECEAELAAMNTFSAQMQQEVLPTVAPNLLAAARMRLDDALDEAGQGSWVDRLRVGMQRTWHHLYAAPALATFLLGCGFLSGNLLTRYQAAHEPQIIRDLPAPNSEGVVNDISSIVPTADPDVVEVSYNRLVPTTFRGRIDEPMARQLLLLGAQKSLDNNIRKDSVSFIAKECNAGHPCEHAGSGELGLRDALLVRLRWDNSAAVRLKALGGLKRFVSEDPKVRDAVLESLMRDNSPQVRTEAIDMLEPVHADSSVRQVLHTLSTDDNPYIRTTSMHVLGTGDGIQ